MSDWMPSLDSVKKFKEALDSPRGALGPFMLSVDPSVYEAAGRAGYDFLLVDMEHGLTTFATLPDIIRGCNCVNVCPVVRRKASWTKSAAFSTPASPPKP